MIVEIRVKLKCVGWNIYVTITLGRVSKRRKKLFILSNGIFSLFLEAWLRKREKKMAQGDDILNYFLLKCFLENWN